MRETGEGVGSETGWEELHREHLGHARPQLDVRRAMEDAARRYAELEWVTQLPASAFPRISEAPHKGVAVAVSVVRFPTHQEVLENGDSAKWRAMQVVLELKMPCGECELLWMPWHPDVPVPERDPGAYHHVNMGRWALMPRRTRNYGVAYAFSGQVHPLEPHTPPAVQGLLDRTNAMFALPRPLNMALVNDYDSGRESIAEHSDDERQLATRDVYCWVSGPASRPGVFRVKKTGKAVPEHLQRLCVDPANAWETRHVLTVELPMGLYVMKGEQFQSRYTHEFPEVHGALLRHLLGKAHSLWPEFPEDVDKTERGAPQKSLVQAAWLKRNKEVVLRAILDKRFGSKSSHEDAENFGEWCAERTSYTLRCFKTE